MAWAHLIFFGAYVLLGIEMVRAVFLRRAAVSAWRESNGGAFDTHQRRFVTDLDLDRAKLPPASVALLHRSRRMIVIASCLTVALLAAQLVMMAVQ